MEGYRRRIRVRAGKEGRSATRECAQSRSDGRTGLLQLNIVREIEGQVVSARNEPEPLVLRPGFEVPHDVAAEVERVAAEIGDREEGNLDVLETVDSRGVVGLVEVAVLAVVDGLVAAELEELLPGNGSLDAIRTFAGVVKSVARER